MRRLHRPDAKQSADDGVNEANMGLLDELLDEARSRTPATPATPVRREPAPLVLPEDPREAAILAYVAQRLVIGVDDPSGVGIEGIHDARERFETALRIRRLRRWLRELVEREATLSLAARDQRLALRVQIDNARQQIATAEERAPWRVLLEQILGGAL